LRQGPDSGGVEGRRIMTCYDCGLKYGGDAWIEAIIPDKIWDEISPTGDQGGILCISCIARRLKQMGYRDIPVWLCGTEPLRAMTGHSDENVDILRNWDRPTLRQPSKEEEG